MLFVSMNYRVAAFGFLPGVEAQTEKIDAHVILIERLALEWIQAYIHEFGGDPTKVTIFGESAGAIAAVAHMTTNGGNNEGLFRGAFLQSGSLVPMGDMQGAQLYYDALVIAVGCDGASDTLECLRGVPYEKLKAAMDEAPSFFGYSSVALSWGPRTDGDFLRDSPRQLAFEGSISRIPVVIGSCEDEGTLFTLSSLNITTTEDLRVYLSTIIFPAASLSDVDNLLHMYPEDPALGAPFHTGILNSPTPHFKRLAAILVYKRRKNTAVLGTAHVTDAIDMFGPSEITDHLIHFVTYLDPNGLTATQVPQHQAALHSANAVNWPKYDPHSKLMLAYVDGPSRASVVRNTDREEQVTYMSTWSSKFWLR
ncbi:hypothetical protein EUX98_g866 [Antrodiella citrinella]|uniref:Carboxylic ester hydrolase n=1 Tax=Antrodiella citrinella TaxID=2447956 RepID=A0A4S4NBJ3_9APHY|nr:hypothetical protein EUX98_g866 [Antrodiella citrinella]